MALKKLTLLRKKKPKRFTKLPAIKNPQPEDEWFRRNMETLLQSVGNNYKHSYSISILPEEIKKTSTDDAYLPRVVSIGPRYRGTRKELLLTEEIKLHCMLSLFLRAGEASEAIDYFKKCSDAIWNLNDQIRASYLDEIDLDDYQLTKIMLVDGCFLLELLVSNSDELDRELRSCLMISCVQPAPLAYQNDDVLSDLIMFENQIPIFILHELSKILFPHVFNGDFKQMAKKINNLVLSVLGYDVPDIQNLDVQCPHLLDVVHSFVNNHNDPDAVVLDIGEQGNQMRSNSNLKLYCCASRLEAAGVSIHLPHEDECSDTSPALGLKRNFFHGIFVWIRNRILKNTDIEAEYGKFTEGLNFEFKYENGKLEISQLCITKTTKTIWRNVIAWEHHKMDWKNKSSSKDIWEINRISSSITSTCGKFTFAALIFNDLICCAQDVKLLKDKGIIVDDMEMSNNELKEFFRTLTLGVDHEKVGSNYCGLVSDLNIYYYSVFRPIRIWKTMRHRFVYRLEWFIKFLKKDYHFVAAVVSLATIVQTVYAIIAYHLSK